MAERTDLDLQDLTRAEFPRLVGLLALYVGSVQTAEDLAQEALIRLHQNWPRVKAMDSPRAWLTRVALNLGSSSLRRTYAERRARSRIQGDRPAALPESADVVAIRDAVSSLPRRERAVIVLRFYEGMSVAEVALQLRCPQGTVKSLTSRGVEQLRRSMGTDVPEGRWSHV